MQVIDVNGNMFGYDHLEIIGADGRPKTLDSGLTSVGLSMPSAFSVSNSPLTSNGTIGVTGAGTISQYIDGTGALRAFPGLTGFVPYVGATQNVNLGEFGLTAGQLTLDVSPTGTAVVATTRWNNTIGSSETTLKGGSVILKNGVDLVARVVNKVTPNTTLTKAGYAAVRVSGAQGQRLAVAYAQADSDANSADTIGLVTETIATNQEGFIITVGQLEDINTTGSLQGETWVDGNVLYLSPTIPGGLTNVKPNGSTGHIVVMGYVEYAHANHGKIYVKIMNGWELDELHNVYINNPLNNQGLFYETSTQLWKNKSISTALGYTPVPTTRQLTINGTTYDLSADRSWSVGTVTSIATTGPIIGGTITGSGTIGITQATTSTNGYLSSTDWNTFNNKQPAGNYITALSGEATGSGPGTASVTLNNASVTAKVLTGVNVTGGSINASDSILTAFGKLQNQINGLIGSSIYQGVWNASTNTPALTSGVGTLGYYYIVNVAGSTNLDGITDWNVGDWAIFDGTAWQQVDNTDSVTSVNGQTGAVSLTSDNIPEGVTNLYFTNLRARQALTLTTLGTSGAATYSNTTGILNIPQYQSVITNPVTGTGTANYVARWTSSSEIGTGVLYDNGTNVGIGTASPNGALSFADDIRTRKIVLWDGSANNNYQFYGFGVESGTMIQSIYDSSDRFLWVSGASSTTRNELMVIQGNGRVGIGTTSPSFKLDVAGTFHVGDDATFNGTNTYINSSNVVVGNNSTDVVGVAGNTMYFPGNGNVGIGTTSPNQSKLHILKSESGSNPAPVLRIGNQGSGYTSRMILTDETTNSANISYLGATQSLGFSVGPSLNQMILTSTGNVGIGTTAPAAKLEIYGTGSTSSTVNFLIKNSSDVKIIESFDNGLIRLNNTLNTNQAIYINNGNSNVHYALDSHIFNVVNDSYQTIDFVTIKGNLGKPAMGVGTMSPNSSAILDLTSISKGFLPPRMTNTEMNAIASPAAGLVVYDTTNNKLTVYNGSSWVPLH